MVLQTAKIFPHHGLYKLQASSFLYQADNSIALKGILYTKSYKTWHFVGLGLRLKWRSSVQQTLARYQ